MKTPPYFGVQMRRLGETDQIEFGLLVRFEQGPQHGRVQTASDAPIELLGAVAGLVESSGTAFGPGHRQIREPPQHLGVTEMGAGGANRQPPKSAPLIRLEFSFD